jgi:hypothetical protein
VTMGYVGAKVKTQTSCWTSPNDDWFFLN